MTRLVALNALKDGINRLRIKGSPDPETLYDLVNGYVNQAGAPQSRPGTVTDADQLDGTRGLAVFDGDFVVFSHQPVTGLAAGYRCEVLVHPTDATQVIAEIHFAEPFLGYLYVVAEFANGDVFHYWLQGSLSTDGTWQANTIYALGDVVRPAAANGLVYRAKRLTAADPVWQPNELRTIGDVVEPTTFNKFKYTVDNTIGDNPKSGATEPAWVATDGAIVIEDVDLTAPTEQNENDGDDLPPGTRDRYGDRYGNQENP